MRPRFPSGRSLVRCAVLGSGLFVSLVHAQETKLVIAGSERMRPALTALAQCFEKDHPGTSIEFAGGGSGRGVAALLDGSAGVAAVARPPTDAERERLWRISGKVLLAFPLGLDAVAVYVRPDNPLTALSLEQVSGILGLIIPTWEDLGIDPKGTALHQHGPECEHDPNRKIPIELFLPGEGLGAAEVLRARCAGGAEFSRMIQRHDSAGSLMDAVRADANRIAFAGWGETSGVRTLPLEVGGDRHVAPTVDTIRHRAYPLTHYVYLLFSGPPEGAAREFLMLALSAEGQRVIARAGGSVVALPLIAE